MKKHLFTILALIALMLTGCKEESKNDPTPVDDGNREYTVRIYVTQDMLNYINNDVYITLPESAETKLTFENPVALDEAIDCMAIGAITNTKLNPSDFKVYVSNTMKGKKGQLKLRWDLSKHDSVSLPEKINLVQGYAVVSSKSSGKFDVKAETVIKNGCKAASLDSHLDKINSREIVLDIE